MKSPKHVFAIVTNMNAFQDIVHLVENMTIYSIWTIHTICQLHSASMATMFSSWKWNAQCSSCYVRTKHNLFVMLVVFRISFLGGFWVVNLLLSCQDRIFPPHVFSVFFFFSSGYNLCRSCEYFGPCLFMIFCKYQKFNARFTWHQMIYLCQRFWRHGNSSLLSIRTWQFLSFGISVWLHGSLPNCKTWSGSKTRILWCED